MQLVGITNHAVDMSRLSYIRRNLNRRDENIPKSVNQRQHSVLFLSPKVKGQTNYFPSKENI
jgi:hypothetical protein